MPSDDGQHTVWVGCVEYKGQEVRSGPYNDPYHAAIARNKCATPMNIISRSKCSVKLQVDDRL